MRIDWDERKNRRLTEERGISFEVVQQVIEDGGYEIRAHPDPERYPDQILLIFRYRDYTWVCPAVRGRDSLFLKTVYPSRKYDHLWRKRGQD